MQPSTGFGPFAAPHRTKQFWLVIGLLVLVAIVAPTIQALLGLPPFPRRIQISSGAVMLAIMAPVVWFGFRLGRIAWFFFAIAMLAFGLWVRYHA